MATEAESLCTWGHEAACPQNEDRCCAQAKNGQSPVHGRAAWAQE